MIQEQASALIVAKPGRMRDSLEALIASIHQIGTVDKADDGPSALKIITSHLPNLVLLDSNLSGDETWTILEQIKFKWPQTHSLVLADTTRQQWMAKAVGVDRVLLTGTSATKFFTVIEELLSWQKA